MVLMRLYKLCMEGCSASTLWGSTSKDYDDKAELKELRGRQIEPLYKLVQITNVLSFFPYLGVDFRLVSGFSGRRPCRLLPRKEAFTGSAHSRA